jgi:serine protease Do
MLGVSRFHRATSRLALIALLALVGPSIVRADDPAPTRSERARSSRSDEASFGIDQLFVPRWRLADGPQVRAAFRQVVEEAGRATVSIQCDGKPAALGGVVSPDGWILTKATPLCGKMQVVLADGRRLQATTAAESREYDLALLKVDATNLPTLKLSDAAAPPVGSFLATVGIGRDPVAVGVMSVAPRAIPAQAGFLGVRLDENLPLILEVFPESPAEAAGIQVGDRILDIAGRQTPSREKLKEAIALFNPGDDVRLSVEREGQTLAIEATLAGQFPGIPMGRSEFQNGLGGKLSVRRFGFPMAFQHDTVLRPADCGGPIVDLDGRVIGFNIARAGRTESYALPAVEVNKVLDQLRKQSLSAAASKPAATIAP